MAVAATEKPSHAIFYGTCLLYFAYFQYLVLHQRISLSSITGLEWKGAEEVS